MSHAGVSGLTIGRLSSYLSRASYLLKKRLNQLKFNNKKMINKSNPQNRHNINSHASGFFRLFRVKLCKYANLRIWFNCTETHFLALIFANYTLYNPITKNEPTAHGKRKRKAKRNIPLEQAENLRNKKSCEAIEKKKPGRQGGSKRTGPRRRKS